MNRWLLSIGGVLNGFFTLFHVLTGWGIWRAPGLSVEIRALTEMLNVGLILFLAFATLVSFWLKKELLTTRLGRSVLVLIALFYGVRVVEEVVISPMFSPVIFGLCLLVAIVYAVPATGVLRTREPFPADAGEA